MQRNRMLVFLAAALVLCTTFFFYYSAENDIGSPLLSSPPPSSSSSSSDISHGDGDDAGSMFERKVTAFIKVHKRQDIAARAASSVYSLYPHMKIIMVDDSRDPFNHSLPPTATYRLIPPDTGISYGRNIGVKMTTTEYLLIMDDDWILLNDSRLIDAFRLLHSNESIGLVAGLLCNQSPLDDCYGYQGSLDVVDGYMAYKEKEFRETMENGCHLTDLGENVILARTRVLQQFPWDNQLTNAEHEDFYLSLKRGHVNVASCPWFKLLHKRPDIWNEYPSYLADRDLYPNQLRLCLKYNLTGFHMPWGEWGITCPNKTEIQSFLLLHSLNKSAT